LKQEKGISTEENENANENDKKMSEELEIEKLEKAK
jgi:hypothetical protein